jgi:hypothetical protein
MVDASAGFDRLTAVFGFGFGRCAARLLVGTDNEEDEDDDDDDDDDDDNDDEDDDDDDLHHRHAQSYMRSIAAFDVDSNTQMDCRVP